MKSEKKLLIAFLLNLLFSVFEFAGGLFTGSVAIVSDAIHDMGDAAGVGISWLLEKKSRKPADGRYTFGYLRYSVIGSTVTTLILLLGSAAVICNALLRLHSPAEIRCNGMILFALIGVAVNLCAALITRKGQSLNQKAVSLHMLEDVLGWAVVLLGALIMRVTGITLLDPLMSMGVALFIMIHSLRYLKEALAILLEKAPGDISADALRARLCALEGVKDVQRLRLWTLDGQKHCATAHITHTGDDAAVKAAARSCFLALGIEEVTLETEAGPHGEHGAP